MTRQQTLLAFVVAIALVAAYWVFAMSPKNDQVATLAEERQQTVAQQQTVRQRIVALENIRSQAPEIEAALAAGRTLVPTNVALPAALRQLQDAADQAGLMLGVITPDRPKESGVDRTMATTVTLTVSGSYFQILDFVRRVEDPALMGRAALVEGMDMTMSEYPLLASTIRLRVFSTVPASPGAASTSEVTS